jgi:hypothetical protein
VVRKSPDIEEVIRRALRYVAQLDVAQGSADDLLNVRALADHENADNGSSAPVPEVEPLEDGECTDVAGVDQRPDGTPPLARVHGLLLDRLVDDGTGRAADLGGLIAGDVGGARRNFSLEGEVT